jgi:hypothetical protein
MVKLKYYYLFRIQIPFKLLCFTNNTSFLKQKNFYLNLSFDKNILQTVDRLVIEHIFKPIFQIKNHG